MRKVLIINIYGIGDILFTTPALRNVRQQFPQAYIGYVCNQRVLPVLSQNPHINKIFIYEKDEFVALWRRSRWRAVQKALGMIWDIRREKFEVVIDLSANTLFSFLGLALRIPERIGFNYKNRSPFLTRKITIQGFEGKPVVEYYFHLLSMIGVKAEPYAMEAFPTPEEKAWAARVLSEQGIVQEDMTVALVPGGGGSWGKEAAFKRWPVERFAELAVKLVEMYGAKIILLGDPGEKNLAEAVERRVKPGLINLVGQTTVGQYLSVLSRCRLAVVNDGGPLHMAVAAGTKTVSIFGPVDEQVYGPYPRAGHEVATKDIACRPCYRRFRRADCPHISCLQTLTVDEVFVKVAKALGAQARKVLR